MKIAILKESRADETRVAATPETVQKYISLGAELVVVSGAGTNASIRDEDYKNAGATIVKSASKALESADLVLKVQRPSGTEIGQIANGASLISILAPHADTEALEQYAIAGIDSYAMDLMPRITRAQSMDVLSSQSNLSGYKAVIDAAAYYGRAMPMMMTAAGTVAPAKVFVMGAGVAGLQAIATARRLGAIVSATDVRYAAKEQVESLGATFVTVDEEAMKDAETEGGYAKEMSDDFKERQAEYVTDHIAKQDIVITTALIPGRPAPLLVSDNMIDGMKPGSVIVDLAVEQGGNVSASVAGDIIERNGVNILGHNNMPGRLAADASSLYARNLYNFIAAFHDKESGEITFDPEDEIIKGINLTRNGAIVHPYFAPELPKIVPEELETPNNSDADDQSENETSSEE